MGADKKKASGWATIEEAAEYASVSSEVVEEWLNDGLEFCQIGRKKLVRIQYEDIDKYMRRFIKARKAKVDISSEVLAKQEKVIETVKNVKRKLEFYKPEKKAGKPSEEPNTKGHLAVINPKTKKKFIVPRTRLVGREHARIKDPETGEVLLFDAKTGDIIMRYGSRQENGNNDEDGSENGSG